MIVQSLTGSDAEVAKDRLSALLGMDRPRGARILYESSGILPECNIYHQ